jgi:hypothetical protein
MSIHLPTAQLGRQRPAAGISRHHWHGHVAWIGLAAALGFGISAVSSGMLEIGRDWVVLLHAAITIPFVAAYLGWSGVSLPEMLRRNLVWGLAGAVVFGALVAFSVQRMDASPRAAGGELVFDLLWLGVVYGVVDALLLNIMPVVAVWQASRSLGRTERWLDKVVTGALAIVASLVVTATYHLGYVEFQGSEVADPLFGNTIMTLGYILTANPITALVAHVALHVASVIHGVDVTVTLPPHY